MKKATIRWKTPLTLLECHERMAEAAIMLQTMANWGPKEIKRFGTLKMFARDSLAVLTRPSDRIASRPVSKKGRSSRAARASNQSYAASRGFAGQNIEGSRR